MWVEGYLIVTKTATVRYRKSSGGVRPNEVPINFGFEIPNSLFERPRLKLAATVDPVKQIVVTPEIRIRAQEILEKELGLKVELDVGPEKCKDCAGTGHGYVDAGGALQACKTCGGSGIEPVKEG